MLAELIAARKSPGGLSPTSMATYPAMRDLLGEGDPLVAFSRLEHRILETLDLGDDVTNLYAAAYSLGLASDGATHLDRLNDFGRDYGYEARQARRHSDAGLRRLARLITSNWIVHAVPTLEIFLVQQSNGSFGVTMRATRQHYIDMKGFSCETVAADGTRRPLTVGTTTEKPSGADESTPETIVQTLATPFVLPAPTPGVPKRLRVTWPGEVWPRFAVSVVGSLSADVVLTSQTLGNTSQVSVEVLE
ncbi:hypothetical protein FB554_2404 [Barrientosiimonas humi]|uniref:Uncharacterized protein n=1 Tax=Barrientosiimonas humi TaxID=999931 RepID=A0A542XEI5_9MICO|nr:hypothetical protein FB554_2404 [Barrientosiimonas humi]CAG7574233.1 hypothetical protein BH39T_PBIAJDOK_02876 [Barrientosiimonas humi]